METRQIKVTTPGGFKEGYEKFEEGDIRTVDAACAKRWRQYGWVEFSDEGEDFEVIGTPDNPTLKVDNSSHNTSADNVG